MAITYLGAGSQPSQESTGGVVVLEPTYPAGLTSTDLSILTLRATPTTATFATPVGWTKLLEGIVNTNLWYPVDHRAAIYVKLGAASGDEPVSANLPTSGEFEARIISYGRDDGDAWSFYAYEDDFTYTDDDDNEYSGHDLFMHLDVGAVAFTVIFNDSVVNPGFDASATGLGAYTHVTLQIEDPEGYYATQTIRGADVQPLSGSTVFSISDYEFKNFRLQNYLLSLYNGSILQDVLTVSLVHEPEAHFDSVDSFNGINAWLRSVTAPQLSRPCYIEDFRQYTRAGRVLSRDKVLGRANEVVITDVLNGKEGSFTLLCGPNLGPSPVSRRDMNLLLVAGDQFMLSFYDEDSLCEEPIFFKIQNVATERLGRGGFRNYNFDISGDPIFRYSIEFVEIDRPATTDVGIIDGTWQNLYEDYSSWLSVSESFVNWNAVLENP